MEIVLGLAGMEVTFFIAARMGLFFVLVDRSVDNAPVVWLLLNPACTASEHQAGGLQETGSNGYAC